MPVHRKVRIRATETSNNRDYDSLDIVSNGIEQRVKSGNLYAEQDQIGPEYETARFNRNYGDVVA